MKAQKVWVFNRYTKRVQVDWVEHGELVRRFHPRTRKVFRRVATDTLFEHEWLVAILANNSRGAALDYFKSVEAEP